MTQSRLGALQRGAWGEQTHPHHAVAQVPMTRRTPSARRHTPSRTVSVPLSVAVLEKPRLRKPGPSLTLRVAVAFPDLELGLVGAPCGIKVPVVAGRTLERHRHGDGRGRVAVARSV